MALLSILEGLCCATLDFSSELLDGVGFVLYVYE